MKQFDPDYGPILADDTAADPDFQFVDRDGIGAPALQAADEIRGGWFNTNPPGLQGAPVFNPDKGLWETFLCQVTLTNVTGDGGGPAPNFIGPGGTWFGEIFTGQMTVFRQGNQSAGEPPAVGFTFFFGGLAPCPVPPSPGAASALLIAGGAFGARRRRIS